MTKLSRSSDESDASPALTTAKMRLSQGRQAHDVVLVKALPSPQLAALGYSRVCEIRWADKSRRRNVIDGGPLLAVWLTSASAERWAKSQGLEVVAFRGVEGMPCDARGAEHA